MAEKFDRSDFLEALFGRHTGKGRYLILVKEVKAYTARLKGSNRFYPDTVSLSHEEFPPDRHVFFGVCPRIRMDPGKKHIHEITALWASLDIGPGGYSGPDHNFVELREAREAVEAFPLQPSIIVQSGQGFHLYWLLESPKKIFEVDAVENLLRKLNDSFRCHSTVGLDSVLRLPDTWNPKSDRTRTKCFVEKLDSGLRYSPMEFQDLKDTVFSVSQVSPSSPAPYALQESKRPAKLAVKKRDLVIENAEPADSQNLEIEVELVDSGSGFLEERSETDESKLTGGHGVAGLTDRDLDRLAAMVADKLTQRFLNDFSAEITEAIVERVIDKLAEKDGFPKPE